MAGRFELDISRWVEKAKGNLDAVVRKVELDVSTSVILGTPVDTGRARANWFASFSAPSGQVSDRVDPSGGASIDRVRGAVSTGKAGHVFYLTNNLPYILRLEQGWSKQAPAGMVMLTVRRYQAIVAGAVGASVR